MAFTPIALPIQQILMTNFVTDIASITNANALLLQAKLEDLINNLEIDTAGLSIGTDIPINYLKTKLLILQDTGFTYQSGSPTPVTIASLTKNISNESILQVDRIIANLALTADALSVNTLTINTSATFTGTSTFDSNIKINSSFTESSESVTVDLLANVGATAATSTITLSSTSRQNIFVTLKASAAPVANPVYDSGSASITPTILDLSLIINFDSVSPPAANTEFTIHIVDVIESNMSTSIVSGIHAGASIPIYIKAGTNNNTSLPIILHDGVNNIGLPLSTSIEKYGTNVSFLYIKDSLNNDRLLAKALVGAEVF
jgi:hypothetical protein